MARTCTRLYRPPERSSTCTAVTIEQGHLVPARGSSGGKAEPRSRQQPGPAHLLGQPASLLAASTADPARPGPHLVDTDAGIPVLGVGRVEQSHDVGLDWGESLVGVVACGTLRGAGMFGGPGLKGGEGTACAVWVSGCPIAARGSWATNRPAGCEAGEATHVQSTPARPHTFKAPVARFQSAAIHQKGGSSKGQAMPSAAIGASHLPTRYAPVPARHCPGAHLLLVGHQSRRRARRRSRRLAPASRRPLSRRRRCPALRRRPL